jgi:hypothetical protein
MSRLSKDRPQSASLIGIHHRNGKLGDFRFLRESQVSGQSDARVLIPGLVDGTPGDAVAAVEVRELIQLRLRQPTDV